MQPIKTRGSVTGRFGDQVLHALALDSQIFDTRIVAMGLATDRAQRFWAMRIWHGRELSRLDVRHGFHAEIITARIAGRLVLSI